MNHLPEVEQENPPADTPPAPIALDSIADAIGAYLKLDAQIHEWARMRETLRKQIERELGEAETGTIAGKSVVRWTHYNQRRLSTSAIRKTFTEAELEGCWVDETRRKFYFLHGDER